MLQMEIYKLLKRKLVWGILVVLFLFAIFINITDFNRDIGRMQYELEKYEAAKGILTDARLQDFHRNYHPAEFDEFENSFMENGTLKKVSELYPDADFKLHFGYFSFWFRRLLTSNEFMQYVIAFVIIAFSMTFTYDRQCGMQEILLSTKNGRRKSVQAKIAAAVITTNIVCLLALILMFAPIFLLTKGIGLDTSVPITPSMKTSQFDVNYLTLVFHAVFITFMAVNVILMLTLIISFIAKSHMAAICATMIILAVLHPKCIAVTLGNHIINRITSLSPLAVVDILSTADQKPFWLDGLKIHCLTVAEIIYPLLLAAESILLICIVTKDWKYYAS